MRFLSHGETLRFFQRACRRAEVDLVYSKGYNPRPKISLPLPRSVGVESDDELLCLKIKSCGGDFDCCRLLEELNLQMSEGIELLKADILKEKITFNKGIVTYRITVDSKCCPMVNERIDSVLRKDSLVIQRQMGPKKRPKQVDVRSYISSLELKDNKVQVDCTFGSAGTIRADEIMNLLGIEQGFLESPVRRVKIIWQ